MNVNKEGERNPYLDARRVWNSEIDRAFSRRHALELLCLACLLIAAGAIGGITYVGSKSKFVPYIVEVDKLGDVVTVGPAQRAGTADPRVIRAYLASFVANARLVTPDQDLQRRAIYAVYALLKTKDPATQKINEYLSPPDTTPFKRAEKVTVDCDVSTVLPVTSTTWQVDWTETTRDRDGGLISAPMNMRATLQISIEPPAAVSRMSDLQRNPLGLYVRDFSWQQR